MRNSIAPIVLLALTLVTVFTTPAHAQSSYFFEGVFSGGSGSVEADNNEVDFDQRTIDLTVHFGSVSSSNIPYNETSFLNRSSFLSYSQTTVGSDNRQDEESTEASGRLVVGSGFFIAAIANIDREADDNDVYEIQLGQFNTDYSSVFIGYVIDDQNDDAETYTAGAHFASPAGSGNTWTAYDIGARFLTEGDDTEYAANFGAAYYPSFRSAFGLFYEYADGRLTDSHEANLYAEYYLSPRFSTRIDGTLFRLGDVDETSAALSLKLRF